jgi:hypothetical protein
MKTEQQAVILLLEFLEQQAEEILLLKEQVQKIKDIIYSGETPWLTKNV